MTSPRLAIELCRTSTTMQRHNVKDISCSASSYCLAYESVRVVMYCLAPQFWVWGTWRCGDWQGDWPESNTCSALRAPCQLLSVCHWTDEKCENTLVKMVVQSTLAIGCIATSWQRMHCSAVDAGQSLTHCITCVSHRRRWCQDGTSPLCKRCWAQVPLGSSSFPLGCLDLHLIMVPWTHRSRPT